jgi:membrane protein YdbS with pleckstrin-like domain
MDTSDERANMTRLIRVVAFFVFFPTATISPALLTFGFRDHWMHASSFAILAVAALIVMWKAPKIAAKYVQSETVAN